MTMYIILKYPVILSTDATARASTAKVSGWWVVVSSELTFNLPCTAHKMFLVDYSLTTGTTTITHDDIPEDIIRVNVSFDSVPETNTTIICSAHFKHAIGIGAFATQKHADLATITSTTIVLPEGIKRSVIKFAGQKDAHCVGGLIRKLLKWRKEEIMSESD